MILKSEIGYTVVMTRAEAQTLIKKLDRMLSEPALLTSFEVVAVNETVWNSELSITVDDKQHDAEIKRLESIIQKANMRRRPKRTPAEQAIHTVYDEVGQFYQEAYGDEYPHFNVEIDGTTIYILCGTAKWEIHWAQMVSDTIAKGECIAVDKLPNATHLDQQTKLLYGFEGDVYDVTEDLVGDALDCDLCILGTESWIWSVGVEIESGRIFASTSAEMYERPGYTCLWLR